MPISSSLDRTRSARTATFWLFLNFSLFSCCICCFKKPVSAIHEINRTCFYLAELSELLFDSGRVFEETFHAAP